MLLLLLSRFSRVRLCATPETAAHQGPPSLGFPRQELEWVAISFSNAWKWKVKVKSLSRVRLSDPMDCSLPGSSIHGIFQARVLESVAIAFSDEMDSSLLVTYTHSPGEERHHMPWRAMRRLYLEQGEQTWSEGVRVYSIKDMRWLSVSTEGHDWLVWIIPRAGRQLRHATLGWVRTVPNPHGKENFLARGALSSIWAEWGGELGVRLFEALLILPADKAALIKIYITLDLLKVLISI